MEDLKIKQKLIGYRKMAGFTQNGLAKELKISCSTYLKKENDPERFTLGEQKSIQEILSQKVPEMPNIFL